MALHALCLDWGNNLRVNVVSIVVHVAFSLSYHSGKSNFLTNRKEANRLTLEFPGE